MVIDMMSKKLSEHNTHMKGVLSAGVRVVQSGPVVSEGAEV